VLALMEAARMMQGADYLSAENVRAYLSCINATEQSLRSGDPVIYDPNQEISLDGLRDVERVHRENGRTEYQSPFDPKTVTDPSLVAWALGVLGRK
jgi:NitT/TauT family transport system substrate-binding protein